MKVGDRQKTIPKYAVVFEIEVDASSPERAATIARDSLLNPNVSIHADVHEYKYYGPADDWFPERDEGWQADFDERGGVRPHIFGWKTLRPVT
jgi:hypothetical protein